MWPMLEFPDGKQQPETLKISSHGTMGIQVLEEFRVASGTDSSMAMVFYTLARELLVPQ